MKKIVLKMTVFLIPCKLVTIPKNDLQLFSFQIMMENQKVIKTSNKILKSALIAAAVVLSIEAVIFIALAIIYNNF